MNNGLRLTGVSLLLKLVPNSNSFTHQNHDGGVLALYVVTQRQIQNDTTGLTTYWAGLSSLEREILAQAGWNEAGYKEFIEGGNASPAGFWQDPLTYVELLVGGVGISRAAKELILPLFGLGTAGTLAGGGEVQNGITVLGRYPTYLQVADDVGGNALDIPIETWNNMSTAEQWALNQKFLDEAIARGDYFYLASRWAQAQVGTFFRMELEYLFSMGYTLSPYQNYLIPPSTP